MPFDTRPKGYNYAEARAFLEAIGQQGRRYYVSPELVIDTVSVTARTANVRFTPENRHRETLLGCPLCAKGGHWGQKPMRGYIVPALRPDCSNKVRSFLLGGKPSVRRQLVDDVRFG
jgi:hypothetical protein